MGPLGHSRLKYNRQNANQIFYEVEVERKGKHQINSQLHSVTWS